MHSAHVRLYNQNKAAKAMERRAAAQNIEKKIVTWAEYTITDAPRQVSKNITFVNKCLAGIPYTIARRLLDEYVKNYQGNKNPSVKSQYAGDCIANMRLRERSKPLQTIIRTSALNDMRALYNEESRKRAAFVASQQCLEIVKNTHGKEYGANVIKAYKACMKHAGLFEIKSKIKPNATDLRRYESALVRLLDCDWWQGQLDRLAARTVEHCYILAGFVKKNAQEYASNAAVSYYRQKRRENADYLDLMEVVNVDTDHAVDLREIADKSSSNPRIKRTELIVRCRGMEEYAAQNGLVSSFVTITAPSKFHANSAKYNGATPLDTHKYLCNQWAKARAEIARAELDYMGVRVVEPHNDATPHWHILLFTQKEQESELHDILSHYALEMDGDEKGAKESRFDAVTIPQGKSATGYIAKYIAKNIDGAHVANLDDHENKDKKLSDSIDRVNAWCRVWGVRQFQFFGTPSITLWRELRRLKQPIEDQAAESIRAAADTSNFCAFIDALSRVSAKINYEEKHNKYDEIIKKIIGIVINANEVDTRPDVFELRVKKASAERAQPRRGSDSRTRVFNCTAQAFDASQPVKRYDINAIKDKIRAENPFVSDDILKQICETVIYTGADLDTILKNRAIEKQKRIKKANEQRMLY